MTSVDDQTSYPRLDSATRPVEGRVVERISSRGCGVIPLHREVLAPFRARERPIEALVVMLLLLVMAELLGEILEVLGG